MTLTSRREVARILRAEAESIRQHGFTDMFSHQFACLLAQVLRPETCEGCLLGDFIPEEYRGEAFPCQHLDRDAWLRITAIPGIREQVAQRFLTLAGELEASAEAEETHRETRVSQ